MRNRRHPIAIPEAVDAMDAVFGVDQITRTGPPPYQRPLRCPGCGVDLDPVNGYRTHTGTAVSAHFRLAKHRQHLLGCRFDFAAESDSIHRRHPAILAVVDGGYQLDLEALLVRTMTAPDNAVAPGATASPWRGDPRQRQHPPQGIPDIIRVLERFDSDGRASEQLTAVYRTEQLSWRAVCFDAATDVKRFQRDLRAGSPSFPRLLIGTVTSIHTSRRGDTYAADIDTRRDHRTDRPVLSDRGRPIRPVVRASSRHQMAFSAGDRIVAFGLWHLFGAVEQPTLWVGNSGNAVAI